METLTLNVPPAVGLSDEQFYQMCVANEEWRLELTAEGELIILVLPVVWCVLGIFCLDVSGMVLAAGS